MKRLPVTVPALALLLLFPAVVPGGAVAAPSRVVSVALYPDMAEVTRVVPVEAASSSVVLEGLTANLIPGSVSARVLEGGLSIGGVTVEDRFRAESVDGKVRELERLIEELSGEKKRREASAGAMRRERELLDKGVLSIYGMCEETGEKERKPAPRLSPAEVEGALALFRSRAQGIDDKVLETEKEARELEKRIAAARKELEQVRNPRPTQEKAVRIDLARTGAGKVSVSYLVPAAGFVPRYNVRLSPAPGRLAFEMIGDAWQRTGEDWKDAKLSFSTARPGRMAQLPPLPPWDVDYLSPQTMKSEMRMLAAAPAPMRRKAMDEAVAGGEAPAEEPVAARRFASFEVTLPGTHDLPGNGEKKSFELLRKEQETKVLWRAIPRLVDGAFLSADGRNATGFPVLSAPAGLFVDGVFVGQGFLPEIPEGREFKVDFGKDPGVQVARKELERKKEEGGVFSKVRRVRYRYEITARNFRAEGVPLEVRDRLPVPHQREIVVRDVEITGGGAVWDPASGKEGDPGQVTWELTLKPGEKRALGLSFVVEYPADREIQGL